MLKWILKCTAFIHRAALILIAVLGVGAALVNQFGPGVGLSAADILYIASGATAGVTVLRSLADELDKFTKAVGSPSAVKLPTLTSGGGTGTVAGTGTTPGA